MSAVRRLTWITSYLRSDLAAGTFVAGYLLDVPPAETRIEAVLDVAPDLLLLFRFGRMLALDERMPYAAQVSHPPDARILDPFTEVTGKVIYLIHDPRSLVSEAVLKTGATGAQLTRMATKLIARIDRPAESGESWQAHVRDWTSPDRLRGRFPALADIHVVRLEDLRRDPAGVLRQVLEFLDLPERVDDARIQRAVRDWTPEKVSASNLMKVAPGVSAFREEPPRVALPSVLPSLAELGEEVEEAYRQRLRDNAEFAELVRRFGYES
jgi:hypothetical protein